MSTGRSERSAPLDGYIPLKNGEIYYREVGQGQPLVILHGGPDFDHSYLLPDMDDLANSFHLIYYDQRGRGKSQGYDRLEDVSISIEVEDLDRLRTYFQLERLALLGHSWGGLLGMEYALRFPDRVSHLILMNTAPASRDDFMLFREHRQTRETDAIEALKALSSNEMYQKGDLEIDAEYYRIHFRSTLRQPELIDTVVMRLRKNFTEESIRKAREIEKRLMDETWLSDDYNLLPGLERLSIPALIIHGEYDIVPQECSIHIAQAMPGASFVWLGECGHFSFLERPDAVRQEIIDFFHGSKVPSENIPK